MAIYQSADAGNLVTESDDAAAFVALLEDRRRNAVLIGPGSGINWRTRSAVLDALAAKRSVLLDAAAITWFMLATGGH